MFFIATCASMCDYLRPTNLFSKYSKKKGWVTRHNIRPKHTVHGIVYNVRYDTMYPNYVVVVVVVSRSLSSLLVRSLSPALLHSLKLYSPLCTLYSPSFLLLLPIASSFLSLWRPIQSRLQLCTRTLVSRCYVAKGRWGTRGK